MAFRALTVQNLVVPGVGDKAAAVLGPIQVGDKAGMALRGGREGVELEPDGVGLDQERWKAKYRGRVRTQGGQRKDTRPLERGGGARLPWAGPDYDGRGQTERA